MNANGQKKSSGESKFESRNIEMLGLYPSQSEHEFEIPAQFGVVVWLL